MNKSQFIKALSTPGTIVTMTSFHGGPVPDVMTSPRTVIKVQSNAVKFSNDSWLYFNDFPASDGRSLDNGDVSVGWATYKIN